MVASNENSVVFLAGDAGGFHSSEVLCLVLPLFNQSSGPLSLACPGARGLLVVLHGVWLVERLGCSKGGPPKGWEKVGQCGLRVILA